MTLPNRCWVSVCEQRLNDSINSTADGEIKCAKSASESLSLASDSRAVKAVVPSDRRTNDSSGKELNSATKLTMKN